MTAHLNHLHIDGMDALSLAKRFGTPLYVYSEDRIASRMREYVSAMREYAGEGRVVYAAKAYLSMRMVRLVEEEGLWLDVASGGELHIALASGFPAGKILFHGNSKTVEELDMALSAGVGRIVVDNLQEAHLLEALARTKGCKQDVLLRLAPGIDPHTHEYLKTGDIDSKFGIALHKDNAVVAALHVSLLAHLNLKGFHCHVGSMILELEPFVAAARIMMHFVGRLRRETGITATELNLGGGLGVRYTDELEIPVAQYIDAISQELERESGVLGIVPPVLYVEPGRSIVAEAGTTLYSVGSVKKLPDGTLVASVDGGMSDNPRPMLYGAEYRVVAVDNANGAELRPTRVVGKHCEEGDTLVKQVLLPPLAPDDVLAFLVTGAYHYSMSSSYNSALRPAVVHVRDGYAFVAVQRQSLADLVLGQTAVLPTRQESFPRAAGVKPGRTRR